LNDSGGCPVLGGATPHQYGAHMSERAPRIRLSAVALPPLLVVRGDELSRDILLADATRFHRRYPAWGKYGVSALAAANDSEVEVICETKLERFDVVVVIERAALERAGVEIVPTFRRPHVTLAHHDLEALVEGL